MSEPKKKTKSAVAHESILLSKAVSAEKKIRISFLDGDFIISQIKWYTDSSFGLKDGKIVNRAATKYWEIIIE